MNGLFNLKAWQVFIVLILYIILTVFATAMKLSIGELTFAQMGGVFRVLGLLIFTIWLYLVGRGLNRIENNPHKFNNVLLAVASICFFTGYASLNLAQFGSLEFIPLGLQMLSMPITLFGLGYLFYNIPMSLKSAELGTKAKYSNCILDALLFFSCAMGIGIWWLQPRMKRVTN